MRAALGPTLYALCLLLFACSPARRTTRFFQKTITAEIENSPVFNQAFTGFHLLDAETGRELCSVNANRYFTPASNTKILTLAACLDVLGDSLPGLRIVGEVLGGDEIRGGTRWVEAWIAEGTGDPTFLHPEFQAWQSAFRYLKTYPVLFSWDPGRLSIPRFGPGWSWDDYPDNYAAERSSFPLYGNTVTIHWGGDNWAVSPERYQDSLIYDMFGGGPLQFKRLETSNRFVWSGDNYSYEDLYKFEAHIPVYEAEKQKMLLLSDTLGGSPFEIEMGRDPAHRDSIIYSTPVDTVYRRMMYQSDNFIAEQLLLVCAGVQFDTLDQSKIIAWVKDSLFAGLPDPPRWVDGSGLSRYNLVCPRFLTALLRKLYLEQAYDRLFSLFPAGGQSGTIKDWYAGPSGKPFIFAKTGTMRGVHCLSGYLITKSGKTLVFSFMHNNIPGDNKAWKTEMARVLERIWAER